MCTDKIFSGRHENLLLYNYNGVISAEIYIWAWQMV